MAKDSVTIDLKGNNSQLKQALSESESSINAYATHIKTALLAASSVIAAKLSVDLFKGMIDNANEAEVNQIRLAKTIENLGDQAVMSADEINEFASAMMQLSTFDDDAIIKVQTSFLKLGLSANQIKDLTQASADLASTDAFNGNLAGAADTLFAAMSKPEMAVRALRSANIALSESETELFDSLNKAGDTVGAQQFLIDKLKVSVGGMAETVANTADGQWKQLQNRFGEISEDLGKSLLPILKALMPAFEGLASFVENVVAPAFADIAEVIAFLVKGAMDLLGLDTKARGKRMTNARETVNQRANEDALKQQQELVRQEKLIEKAIKEEKKAVEDAAKNDQEAARMAEESAKNTLDVLKEIKDRPLTANEKALQDLDIQLQQVARAIALSPKVLSDAMDVKNQQLSRALNELRGSFGVQPNRQEAEDMAADVESYLKKLRNEVQGGGNKNQDEFKSSFEDALSTSRRITASLSQGMTPEDKIIKNQNKNHDENKDVLLKQIAEQKKAWQASQEGVEVLNKILTEEKRVKGLPSRRGAR